MTLKNVFQQEKNRSFQLLVTVSGNTVLVKVAFKQDLLRNVAECDFSSSLVKQKSILLPENVDFYSV